MIKLGVSACLMHPDPTRLVFGPKQLDYFENDMARFLFTSETLPILIPQLDTNHLKTYIDHVDALVLQGGSDVSPSSYGEKGIENNRWPGDVKRDDYELKLIELALKKKIPILGICRGMQILNVFFGGSLYQDLSLQTNTSVEHRNAQKYDKVFHEIINSPDSYIYKAYEHETMLVNSVHHQGIKELGKDLIVESKSSCDSIVEAFRYENDNQFVWAMQWHPEFNHSLDGTVLSATPIIKTFIEKVKAR